MDFEVKDFPCPCGKGTYTDYKDNTPGYREHEAYMYCEDCAKKYKLVKGRSGYFYPVLKDEYEKD